MSRKIVLPVVLLFALSLMLVNQVSATATISNYSPTGVITTPYPTISALIHVSSPSFVYLNKTTMKLDNGAYVNYTVSYANQIQGDNANLTRDVYLVYSVQKWLNAGIHNVTIFAKVSPTTNITKTWFFTVEYDPATKALLNINSTLVSMNKTVQQLASNYTKIWAEIQRIEPILFNTATYWNSTIEQIRVTVQNVNNLFGTNGSLSWLSTISPYSWVFWALPWILGAIIALLALNFVGLLLLARRQGQTYYPPTGSAGIAVSDPGAPGPKSTKRTINTSKSNTYRTEADTKSCPTCGHNNRLEAMFCSNCKAKLSGAEEAGAQQQ